MGNSYLDQQQLQEFNEFVEKRIVSDPLTKTSNSEITPEELTNQTKEKILNESATVKNIEPSIQQIKLSPELIAAFDKLRQGYPDLPLEQQTQGREFRKNADLIIDQIAAETMADLDPKEVVVLMPWRAGLAFANAYRKLGVERFYHVSARRDHQTLETIVDYQEGKIYPSDTVIIADPMLATGNTAFDSLDKILEQGVSPEHILINAVVAAPIGVRKVKINPSTRVVVGMLDQKLDHRGYIVPGLGDFGDKYFHEYSSYELSTLAVNLGLSDETRKRLFMRFNLSQ